MAIRTANRCWPRRAFLASAAWCAVLPVRADPLISEFMASNKTTLVDDRGEYSDWIEIYNPDPAPVDLAGWYLTDAANQKNKWQFPAVTLPSGGYLVVFASNNSRRDPARPLHTNFALSASGEYLALVKPDGTTVAAEFAPQFPEQFDDISYGVAQTAPGQAAAIGYLRTATPGAANGGPDDLMGPGIVTFSRASGLFQQAFNLTLSGAGPGQRIRYVLAAPSSTGAVVPEPTAASPEYTGPIPITFTVVVRAAVFSTGTTPRGRTATAHFLKLDSQVANFSTQLPVLLLDVLGLGTAAKDNIDHSAWVYAYDPAALPFAGRPALASAATASVRGNFSASFLKSSFSIELQDDRGRVNPQPLLGLDTHQDWAVIGPWLTDRSYIRNAYIYALSNRLGRWAPRVRFVEMFVNEMGDDLDPGDYYGIGVLTDRIKVSKERINITPLEANDDGATSITGGYILKLDVVPDPDHYNFITDHGIPERPGTAVVVDTPNAAKLSGKQRAYIRGYVQQMENALFADHAAAFATRTYLDYIDVPSWVDHHILELFSANVDALYRSEYFYKDRGGKLFSGPVWDFDGSMGNGDPRSAAWDTWETADDVDLWNYGWFGRLARDPEFMQAWIDRWQSLRRSEFSTENLRSLADALAAQIGPEAAARDVARWADNKSRFAGGYLGEVAHLKDWITQRAGWIDRQFVAEPTAAVAGGSLTFTAPGGVQLAYTLDGSDPRSLGGAIAPNARLAASPLTVPATANVHVRSYDAGKKSAFPGSPWSGAAVGAASSPLAPRARLVNLSTRALIRAEEGPLIAGVSVADTAAKGFVVRAVGPTLAAFGATDTLPDPALRILRDDGTEIHRNISWESGADVPRLVSLTRAVGAFPLTAESADSALIAPLPAGRFTIHMASAAGLSGIGLAELYAYDDNGRILNLSIRARVRTGDGVLIGGFFVQGTAYKRMLLRAVGPSLRAFGVGDTLADPVITIYSGQTVEARNDDWQSDSNGSLIATAATSVGAFALPAGSLDAAVLVTLRPGAYTVEVSGKEGAEGVALLEIYDLP